MSVRVRSTAAKRRPRIGISEVRASFRAPEPEPFCLAYFARPLSIPITPAFYNAGFTADQVIVLRAFVNAVALGLLVLGSYPAFVAAVVMYLGACVLDCVDGNLSRLCDEGSYWGKFIDGLIDEMLVRLAPIAVGIGLWLNEGNGLALMIGALVSVVALFTSMTRQRFSFGREWMTNQTGPLTEADKAFLTRCDRFGRRAINVVANVDCFATLIILLPDGAWYYLLVMLAVETSANIVWLVTLLRQANGVLRRPRQAVHAGTPITKFRP